MLHDIIFLRLSPFNLKVTTLTRATIFPERDQPAKRDVLVGEPSFQACWKSHKMQSEAVKI
jgi:hypothetical protein